VLSWVVRGTGCLCAVVVAACAGLGDTEEVVVIARGDDGNYGLHAREVRAHDLHGLRGDSTELIARPTIVFDDGDVSLEGGGSVDVQYGRDGDILVPLDYRGLIAVTAYHHLDRADAYFRELGWEGGGAPIKTLYLPLTDYGGELGPREFHDNASYDPALGAFLLFDERWLDYVPLAANEGVITHEFAHAVFHQLTGVAGPDDTWDQASARMWRSVNEGLADVHAVAFTGDPRFGRASAGRFVLARDVADAEVALTDELLAAVWADGEPYDPYPIGTVFAAVFWDYRTALVDLGWAPDDASRAMSELAFDSARALVIDPAEFHLAQLAQAVAEQAAERAAVCDALFRRADPIMSEVTACR
jgi:hypothetical protein